MGLKVKGPKESERGKGPKESKSEEPSFNLRSFTEGVGSSVWEMAALFPNPQLNTLSLSLVLPIC